LQREVLQKALGYYQRFIYDLGPHPAFQANLAEAYARVGAIQERLGHDAEAREALEEAVRLGEGLREQSPGEFGYRFGLANGYNRLGSLHRRLGDRGQAETYFRCSLALRRALREEVPDDPRYQAGLANTLNNLGLLLQGARGREGEAEEAYAEAVGVGEGLVKKFPDNMTHRLDLAGILSNRGAWRMESGRPDEAERAFAHALELLEGAPPERAALSFYRHVLAGVRHNHATALRLLNRPGEARAAYEKALALRERLAEDFPRVPAYRAELASCRQQLGLLSWTSRDYGEAERHLTASVELWRRLAKEHADNPAYPLSLAETLQFLAGVWAARGSPAAAAAHAEAVEALEGLVNSRPDEDDYRGRLAAAYAKQAEALAPARPAEALAAYAKARPLLEHLVARRADPEYRRALVHCCTQSGNLLQKDRRWEEADGLYRRAIELLRGWPERPPPSAKERAALATLLHNRSVLVRLAGWGDETFPASDAALAALRELVKEPPEDAGAWCRLGAAHRNRAQLLLDRGDRAGACAPLGEAVACLRRAVELDRDAPDPRRRLQGACLLLTQTHLDLGEHAAAARTSLQLPGLYPRSWLGHLEAARAHVRCIALAGPGSAEGKAYAAKAKELLAQAVRLGRDEPQAALPLAWFLAVEAEGPFRDPAAAQALARQAVGRDGQAALGWSALGHACYRGGDYRGALDAFTKAGRQSTPVVNGFARAMAHWRLGEKDEARRCFDQAEQQLKQGGKPAPLPQRFRAEAAALLGR
jgi:tetratricopeptide (TPR) repeat protein